VDIELRPPASIGVATVGSSYDAATPPLKAENRTSSPARRLAKFFWVTVVEMPTTNKAAERRRSAQCKILVTDACYGFPSD